MDDLFDIIKESYQSTVHGRRQLRTKLINKQYSNITQEIVALFIDGSENCQLNKLQLDGC